MFIFKLLGTASLIASTLANPVPHADTKLAKRAEEIHLVNCGNVYSAVIVCISTLSSTHELTIE